MTDRPRPHKPTRPPTAESLALARHLGRLAADEYVNQLERGEIQKTDLVEQTIVGEDDDGVVVRHRLFDLNRKPGEPAKPVDRKPRKEANPRRK